MIKTRVLSSLWRSSSSSSTSTTSPIPSVIFVMFSTSHACNRIPQHITWTILNPSLRLVLHFSRVWNIDSPLSSLSLHKSSAPVSLSPVSSSISPARYFGLISLPPSYISSSSSLSNAVRFPSLPTQHLLSHVFFSIDIVSWTNKRDVMFDACTYFDVHHFAIFLLPFVATTFAYDPNAVTCRGFYFCNPLASDICSAISFPLPLSLTGNFSMTTSSLC